MAIVNCDRCHSDVTKVRFVNPAEEDVCQTNGGEEGQVIIWGTHGDYDREAPFLKRSLYVGIDQ